MEKIPSFQINHLTLMPGVYVSRYDIVGDAVLTTFDIRMTAPNRQPALSISALHAIEHLAATFLRNHPQWKDKVVYWGPMGCCTGNYLILKGKYAADDVRHLVVPLMCEVFDFISGFEGDIPGATPRDCGNYLLMSLPEAKMASDAFLEVLKEDCPVEYPD